MRQKNWRVVITGFLLMILAGGFFLLMLSMAGSSNNPKAMMQTVGTLSGGAGGISVAMIIGGLIGKKVEPK